MLLWVIKIFEVCTVKLTQNSTKRPRVHTWIFDHFSVLYLMQMCDIFSVARGRRRTFLQQCSCPFPDNAAASAYLVVFCN